MTIREVTSPPDRGKAVEERQSPGSAVRAVGSVLWTRWRASPASLRAGATLLASFVILGVMGPALLVDPNRQDLNAASAAPGTAGHLLGTDPLGRDVLSWIASSVAMTVRLSLIVVCAAALIGAAVGIISGYVGGVLDALLMRLVDLNLAVPWIILFIAASAVVVQGTGTLIVLLVVVGWIPYARLVRTKVQVERRRASLAAARLAGAGRLRIALVHLLPACMSVMLVWGSLHFGFVMLSEASLSFLGLGVQPPDTSLGFIIAQGRDTLAEAWWVVVFPGLVLALLLLAANLIGDGLQELFGVNVDRTER